MFSDAYAWQVAVFYHYTEFSLKSKLYVFCENGENFGKERQKPPKGKKSNYFSEKPLSNSKNRYIV